MKKKRRIGIMTGGGDCPGLNAVIRAVAKTAMNDFDMEVIGFEDGFVGLVESKYHTISYEEVSNILTLGGTILGTSNKADPFNYYLSGSSKPQDLSDNVLNIVEELQLEAVVCIGGDGTMRGAAELYKKGFPAIGVPKTIDNDVLHTDVTFGFNSALDIATDAVDRLHTTAMSHHRVMILEVMGRYAGWLALHTGVAGGGDIILIPEMPFDMKEVCNVVDKRSCCGKRFSIIVVAEGAKPKGGEMVVSELIKDSPDKVRLGGISRVLANKIQESLNIGSRATILGHIQRGGSPTAFDRILGTSFGSEAVGLVVNKRLGRMVVLKQGEITSVPIEEVSSGIKTVPVDCALIRHAVSVGTSFGVSI